MGRVWRGGILPIDPNTPSSTCQRALNLANPRPFSAPLFSLVCFAPRGDDRVGGWVGRMGVPSSPSRPGSAPPPPPPAPLALSAQQQVQCRRRRRPPLWWRRWTPLGRGRKGEGGRARDIVSTKDDLRRTEQHFWLG